MKANDLKPVKLVTAAAELTPITRRLGKAKRIAVDTESNSLFAYRERVCLIQFSTEAEDILIDPLAVTDLSCLETIFSNPKIEKIFHAAEYDLICLRRDFKFKVSNLFDTMIAARVLGRQEIGLGSLLDSEFGVRLEKRFQRANWGKRPLTEDLLDYARLDTHFLIPLRDSLAAELEKRSLTALAEEDFRRLEAYGPTNGGQIASSERSVDIWRISGSYDLSPQQASVLQKLCEYRDEVARQRDRPLFKVMSDRLLLEITQRTPLSPEELGRTPGMSPGLMRQHGRSLLRAVRNGLDGHALYPPKMKRPDSAYSNRLDKLRNWRKSAAAQMGVPSDVVLPRDLMQRIASGNPNSQAELENILEEVPWRLEHFGEPLLRLIRKD